MNMLANAAAATRSPIVPDVTQTAMLCGLTVRTWAARRLDRQVSAEVNADKGAARDVAKVHKALLANEALAAVMAAANAARAEHYKRTLPWSDAGPRILSAAGYLDFEAAMKPHKAAFDAAVADFLASYPDSVAEAQRTHGALFDAADYPTVADLASRFFLGWRHLPMPDARDFRVQVSAEAAEAIRAGITADVRDAMAAATRDVFGRVAETVGHMAARLREYRPADGPGARASGVFRDSLVENVRELAALLPTLNVTGDPVLADLSTRLFGLCQWDAAELRTDDAARATVAREAQSIVDSVSAYMA